MNPAGAICRHARVLPSACFRLPPDLFQRGAGNRTRDACPPIFHFWDTFCLERHKKKFCVCKHRVCVCKHSHCVCKQSNFVCNQKNRVCKQSFCVWKHIPCVDKQRRCVCKQRLCVWLHDGCVWKHGNRIAKHRPCVCKQRLRVDLHNAGIFPRNRPPGIFPVRSALEFQPDCELENPASMKL